MKNVNLLYIPMTRKEQVLGWSYLLFQLLLLPSILLSAMELLIPNNSEAILNFIFFCINFLVVGWIFRRFLGKTFQDIHGRIRGIFWKAILGFIISQVATILLNDLLFYFFPKFYIFTDTGPQFQNLNDAAIFAMSDEHYLLMLIGTVLLVPPVEELFYRGLVFGGLYAKSRTLAYVISVCFFAAIHMIGFIGSYSPTYLILSFLQYIPAGICLAWSYASSESILTPILIHMVINAIAFL